MSVLSKAQGACKEDMMSGELLPSSLFRGCHPEQPPCSVSIKKTLAPSLWLWWGLLCHRLVSTRLLCSCPCLA
eukprot:2264300-Rhodomonas_salina.1